MSEHVQHTIDELKTKREAIDDLIGRLEWFQREFPQSAAAVTTNGDRPKAVRSKQAKQTPIRRAARSLPDDAQSQVVIGLLKKHGPLQPRELAERLGINAWKVSRVTKPLLKAKAIEVAGKTNNRTFHLPGHPPAKEVP